MLESSEGKNTCCNLSWIFGTLVKVEGENQPCKVMLMMTGIVIYTYHTHTHKHELMTNNNNKLIKLTFKQTYL